MDASDLTNVDPADCVEISDSVPPVEIEELQQHEGRVFLGLIPVLGGYRLIFQDQIKVELQRREDELDALTYSLGNIPGYSPGVPAIEAVEIPNPKTGNAERWEVTSQTPAPSKPYVKVFSYVTNKEEKFFEGSPEYAHHMAVMALTPSRMVVKSAVDQLTIDRIKKEFEATVRLADNMWRTPVFLDYAVDFGYRQASYDPVYHAPMELPPANTWDRPETRDAYCGLAASAPENFILATCGDCSGTGAATDYATCQECKGEGRVKAARKPQFKTYPVLSAETLVNTQPMLRRPEKPFKLVVSEERARELVTHPGDKARVLREALGVYNHHSKAKLTVCEGFADFIKMADAELKAELGWSTQPGGPLASNHDQCLAREIAEEELLNTEYRTLVESFDSVQALADTLVYELEVPEDDE